MKLNKLNVYIIILIIQHLQILSSTKVHITYKESTNKEKILYKNYNANLYNNNLRNYYSILNNNRNQFSGLNHNFANNFRKNKLTYNANANFNLGADIGKLNKFYARSEKGPKDINSNIQSENDEKESNHIEIDAKENENNIEKNNDQIQKNSEKSNPLFEPTIDKKINYLRKNIEDNNDQSDKRLSSENENLNNNINKFKNINNVRADQNNNKAQPSKKILDNTQNSLYRAINSTSIAKDLYTFRKENRIYDYKILDRQIEEMFQIMLYKTQKRLTKNGLRDFIQLFTKTYNSCDKDKDNVLNFSEFKECLKSDQYLNQIIPTPKQYSNNEELTSSEDVFYKTLFNLIDDRNLGYINFVSYIKIRLFSFSWRQCSIYAPYMEEVDFECAIDIISGHKTASRTLIRQIFFMSLYFSNNPNQRNIDFLTFVEFANCIKLYGMINQKEDEDITRNEFNLALDGNLLPIRYNQMIIDQIFDLVQDHDKLNQGLDMQSFIFYDLCLQLFSLKTASRPYYLNKNELIEVFNNPIFPNKTLAEISFIPQFNLTADSYQMYQYYNITQFNGEENYLYKFLETEVQTSYENKYNLRGKYSNSKFQKNFNYKLNSYEKNFKTSNSNKNKLENSAKNVYPDEIEIFNNKFTNDPLSKSLSTGYNNLNITFNLNATSNRIFDALDGNSVGYISFKDFAVFYHIAYVFTKEDKYSKGKLTAGRLYDKYSTYSDYPVISYHFRERSVRFNSFDVNSYIDLLDTVIIMRLDDMVRFYTRKTDLQTINEIDVKSLLSKINMKYIPDSILNQCLRGIDYNNIPKYEWECCFIQGMTLNLNYYEAMSNYLTAKNNNITLSSTVFYNIDPNYE